MTRSPGTAPDISFPISDSVNLPGLEDVPSSALETIQEAAHSAFTNHVRGESARISVDPTPALEPLRGWVDGVVQSSAEGGGGRRDGRRLGRWCASIGLGPTLFFHLTAVVRDQILEVAAGAETELGSSEPWIHLEGRLQRGLSDLVGAYLDELEALNARSLSDVADGLAHEVRNPLNAAALNLTLLERHIERGMEGNQDVRRLLEEIRTSLRRMEESTRATAGPDATGG